MIRILFFCVAGVFLLTGCIGSFTSREIKLVNEDRGVMRVLRTDCKEDSVFLRKRADTLEREDVECSTFQRLKERMLLTVNDSVNPGVGIAAPQVGIGRTLIAVQRFDKPGEPFEFYINPVIESYSEAKIWSLEGCLSVPGIQDSVRRSEEITVSYVPDPSGEQQEGIVSRDCPQKDFARRTEQIKGFTAIIFQHETDHLKGVLFIDRIK